MKRSQIAGLAAALVALAMPATALGEPINSSISIHVSFDQDRIYGVIQAAKHKCENNRPVNLQYAGKSPFSNVDDTTTDGLGQYEFEAGIEKRGTPFEPGFYRVKAPRKDVPGDDFCRGATSRVVSVGFQKG